MITTQIEWSQRALFLGLLSGRERGDDKDSPANTSTCRFDPRPREGGDLRPLSVSPSYTAVSIHAPAKGATWVARSRSYMSVKFQSTPPRRGRPPVDCMRHHQLGAVSIHAPAKGATRAHG